MKLDFSPDLKLPDDAVTQTFAFLARKGAGKTYGAGKLVELLVANGDQVVVIDPVGVWYGLRLAADGKKPGIPIAVFGGLHGDIPLEPTSGALVARVVVERGASIVLDLSQFRKNDRKRFVVDFAEELFHRKKSSRSPVHVVVEEAQVFVPQQVRPDEARMLGAFEDLTKLGRNFGIGVTLISQRPQSINKDALNQTECLVVLQTNGAQERAALEKWIVEQGLDVGELVDSLPGLERGEAWVWSPSWLRTTKRIHIGTKWTFDASATPERGTKAAQVEPLDPVELDAIAQGMAASIERAQAEDPKALRAKVLELRAELERVKKAAPLPSPAPAKTKTVEVPVLKDAQIGKLAKVVERLGSVADKLAEGAGLLREVAGEIVAGVHKAKAPEVSRHFDQIPGRVVEALRKGARAEDVLVVEEIGDPARARYQTVDGRPARPGFTPPRAPARPAVAVFDDGFVPKGSSRAMIDALRAAHPRPLSRAELGVHSVMSIGGTFSDYLSILRTHGIIEEPDGTKGPVALSPAAVAKIPANGALRTSSELAAAWAPKLKGSARRMFEILLAARGASMTRARLAEEAGLQMGGTFSDYLSILRSKGLLVDVGRDVAAAPALFLGDL